MRRPARHSRWRWLFPLALVASLVPAWLLIAAPDDSGAIAFDAPAFQSDVLDEAGILGDSDLEALRRRIRELREENDVWAAVYVTTSLHDESIETAAVKVFEKWQLGQAGKDNGVLVLIAPTERRMRIEVGYGLEGVITDVFSKRVIDDIYQPAFRESRFADGLMQGFDAMARAVSGDGAAGETSVPEDRRDPPSPGTASPEPSMANVQPPRDREFDWTLAGYWFFLAFAANMLPALLYSLAVIYGRSKGRSEQRYLWKEINVPIFIFGFLAIFFGLFSGVFGAAFGAEADSEAAVPLLFVNGAFVCLFGFPFILAGRRYVSAAAFRRYRARERLLRMRRRSKKARMILGAWFDPTEVGTSRGGTRVERSSSSSSSSSSGSSSSSSSGGGSSGGGGASGSW